MPYSIRAQLEQLHQKIQQLIWLNGVCWGLTILLSLGLLAIALDWSLDITDPAIRLILALGIGAALVWTVWKHLLIPLQTPVTDLDLALKIENRHPALKDSLSSSIEFDRQPAAHYAGSAQMRQAVIQESYQRASQINFLELIDTHPIRKTMISAAILCLLVAGLSILHPRQMILGFHRLVLPFSAPEWPQSVELQILDENLVPIETGPGNPYQVAEGQSFQFFVENRKGPPRKTCGSSTRPARNLSSVPRSMRNHSDWSRSPIPPPASNVISEPVPWSSPAKPSSSERWAAMTVPCPG